MAGPCFEALQMDIPLGRLLDHGDKNGNLPMATFSAGATSCYRLDPPDLGVAYSSVFPVIVPVNAGSLRVSCRCGVDAVAKNHPTSPAVAF